MITYNTAVVIADEPSGKLDIVYCGIAHKGRSHGHTIEFGSPSYHRLMYWLGDTAARNPDCMTKMTVMLAKDWPAAAFIINR